MDQREYVARRVSAACAELRVLAEDAGMGLLAHILAMAVLEARQVHSPPLAPATRLEP